MSDTKEAIALSGTALDFARSLVEAGEYETVDAAVSGVLDGVREDRAAEWKLIEKEVVRRRQSSRSEWIWPESDTHFEDRFQETFGKAGDGK